MICYISRLKPRDHTPSEGRFTGRLHPGPNFRILPVAREPPIKRKVITPTGLDDPVRGVRVLKDGRPTFTSQALFERLDTLGIPHTTVSHPPVFTVEQARELRGDLPGAHSKNLFLRNKKGRMWLITCEESLSIDLNQAVQCLDAKRFSFASAERLMLYLGVIPGAVTPFSVLNDTGNAVTMVLDARLLGETVLNFHPLDNAMTTQISSPGLMTFLRAVNHDPIVVDFEPAIPVAVNGRGQPRPS